MKIASSMVGTVLFGAAVLLIQCGDDAPAPSGGGGSGGSAAGSGGSQAGGGGAGGSAGSTDGGPAGGTAGGGGSGGDAGGRDGSTAGSSGQDGGGGGATGNDADGMCPAMQPGGGVTCNVDMSCPYGVTLCSCLMPGPMGTWTCRTVSTDSGADGNSAACPAVAPDFGDPCPDAGIPAAGCVYSGLLCKCNSGAWECEVQ